MPVGRPREFDVDAALDRALELFWRQGYEGTALSDLTDAMGINRPSLYAAYGNKEQLFVKALDRYMAVQATYLERAMALPTAREVVATLLADAVDLLTRPGLPHGCMTVQAALATSPDAEAVRRVLAERRTGVEAAIRRRLEQAADERDLPAGAEPAVLARLVNTVYQGLAVQAAGGADREDLLRVVDLAMRAWPQRS